MNGMTGTRPELIHLICSIAEDEPVVRAFKIDADKQVGEIELEIAGLMAAEGPAPARIARSAIPARRPLLRRSARCRSSTSARTSSSRSPTAHERARKVKPQYTRGELVGSPQAATSPKPS